MFSKIIKRYTYQRKPEPVSEGGFTPTLNFLKSCFARQVGDVDSVDKKTINPSRNLVSGFTLIETIVAIIILLSVISFAFTISYNNTKYADLAKDQVVATFLIQDVFDYVIAHKKQNIIGDGDELSDWLDGFGKCQDIDGCSIDTSLALEDPSAVRGCSGECKELQQQTTGDDIYGHIGEDTKFTRKVTIDEINPEIEAVVTVDISWKSGFLTRNFSMSTNIFNTRY